MEMEMGKKEEREKEEKKKEDSCKNFRKFLENFLKRSLLS